MEFMNTKQAAAYIGCSKSVLGLWRREGRGPKWFRAGKLVRYKKAAIDAWIEANSNGQGE